MIFDMTNISSYRPRRVLTFIPGSVLIDKSDPLTLYARDSFNGNIGFENRSDTIIFDLEDSVSLAFKYRAIDLISDFLESNINKTKIEIAIRVNANTEPKLREKELVLISNRFVDAVIVPKIELNTFHDSFFSYKKFGKKVFPIIETVSGFLDRFHTFKQLETDLCSANINEILPVVILGLDDLSSDLRIHRETFFTEPALSSILGEFSFFSRRFNVGAIGPVYNVFKNHTGLNNEINRLKSIGFSGTLCVFPPYVKDIKKAFTPSNEEIEICTEILNQLELAEKVGKGWVFYQNTKYDLADKSKLAWNISYGKLCKQFEEFQEK
jgi:(S)-citramalyl-CoA lyase